MKNRKAVIAKVKVLSKIVVIDIIDLCFIWIILCSWSLHKPFIGSRGWLTLGISMVCVNAVTPWFTEPQRKYYSAFSNYQFKNCWQRIISSTRQWCVLRSTTVSTLEGWSQVFLVKIIFGTLWLGKKSSAVSILG